MTEQMDKKPINLFWFRRDLRLDDNHGLYKALSSGLPLITLFIFDLDIIKHFAPNDTRFSFIYNRITELNRSLISYNHSIKIRFGSPKTVFTDLISNYNIRAVFANEDYEPYGIQRDSSIKSILNSKNIPFNLFSDHVLFHPNQILKPDNKPYTIFTPYSKKWRERKAQEKTPNYNSETELTNLDHETEITITKQHTDYINFTNEKLVAKYPDVKQITEYETKRDYPFLDATTRVSSLLRFGIISIRKLYTHAKDLSFTYVNELIWREFYITILFHFPQTVTQSFKQQFDQLPWTHNEKHFEKWCSGKTGYPIVDAGMRQLNETGFMHNRLRMITSSFLTKHLFIDWRWGESYFAQKLHDYEQASNVGGWQWAASTGNDAVPYFRIFNPTLQTQRFDKNNEFIQKWVPEFTSPSYPKPIVEHSKARQRTLEAYKQIKK